MDSFFDRANRPMMRLFDLIYKWLILNLLFLLFTIVGLVLFGIFPSLLTLFTLSKRILQDKDESLPLFQTYKETFFGLLKKGNLLFLFVVVVGIITLFDVMFLYNNYLGVNEVTIFGVILSIGGLLLAFVVSGTIASMGIIVAFYERFSVKDTIKFSLLTTLSNPLLVLQFLAVIGLGYLIFSILISAAPFLGISMPVWILVILYQKTYVKLFTIKHDGPYNFMYIRYLVKESDVFRILDDLVSSSGEPISHTVMSRLLKQDNLDTINSLLVLDSQKQVVGFLLLIEEEGIHRITAMAVDRNHQRRGIGSAMIQHVITQKSIQTIVCDIDMHHIHPNMMSVQSIGHLLQACGFQSVTATTYQHTR